MFRRPFRFGARAAMAGIFVIRDSVRRCVQNLYTWTKCALSFLISAIYWVTSSLDAEWTQEQWGAEATLQALFWTELQLPVTKVTTSSTLATTQARVGAVTHSVLAQASSCVPTLRAVEHAFEVTPQEISLRSPCSAGGHSDVSAEFESSLISCIESTSAGSCRSDDAALSNAGAPNPNFTSCALPHLFEGLFAPARGPNQDGLAN